MNNATANMEVAARLVAAIEAADIEAVRALYQPNARIWHNTSGKLQTVDENIKSVTKIHSYMSGLRYEILRREPTSNGYFQQHILRGTLASGKAFALNACVIIDIEEGLITRLDEYFDSAEAAG